MSEHSLYKVLVGWVNTIYVIANNYIEAREKAVIIIARDYSESALSITDVEYSGKVEE